jgi:hypothetical protein
MFSKTWDGKDVLSGCVVYYVDITVLGDPVRSCVAQYSPVGMTSELVKVKALSGRIFMRQQNALNFKRYHDAKKTQAIRRQVSSKKTRRGLLETYLPRHEI